MLNEAPNITSLWASMIVEECIRNGIEFFSICPGSRSAPLAMAIATGGPLTSSVHFDERGAAFHALGYAKAQGRPAVFICTSGTAVANALPAVVEASRSNIPLLLITADRPPELQDTGSNQTIDQIKIFGDYVRWYHSLPCPSLDFPAEAVLTAVDQAIHRAQTGPVHLNCPFRDPLTPRKTNFDNRTYTQNLASWFDGPYTYYPKPASSVEKTAMDSVSALLSQNRRGMILVGELSDTHDVAAVEAFAEKTGWPVLADIASGLRLGSTPAHRIAHFDDLLRSTHRKSFDAAQVILHFGGAMTSRGVATFLEATPSRNYIHVANHPNRQDPSHRVSHRFQLAPRVFIDSLAANMTIRADDQWVAEMTDADARAEQIIHDKLDTAQDISEHGVLRAIANEAPEDSVLFLGNSMPIRDADIFASGDGPKLRVAVNRGASGIDGNIATAAGHGKALNQPVTAILGDLATLHDLNSLALLQSLRKPLVLIVINNDGGGIFSFLPIAEYPEHFEKFFATPHGRTFQHAAAMFSLDYHQPTTMDELRDTYRTAINGKHPTLIEVQTNRTANESAHRKLRNTILDTLNTI